jgi:hypothetical protein
MSLATSPNLSHSPPDEAGSAHVFERQTSPTFSSTSPTLPDSAGTESVSGGFQDHRDDVLGTKLETASSSSKIKKKFSDIDFRGAMADLGGKRTGIEDFYIQLDEPHRMFWCPGEVIKGMPIKRRRNLYNRSSALNSRSTSENPICDIEAHWSAVSFNAPR